MERKTEEWHANWMGDLNLYAAFFENLMGNIKRCANTKEKFRITLEYDPETGKTTVTSDYTE